MKGILLALMLAGSLISASGLAEVLFRDGYPEPESQTVLVQRITYELGACLKNITDYQGTVLNNSADIVKIVKCRVDIAGAYAEIGGPSYQYVDQRTIYVGNQPVFIDFRGANNFYQISVTTNNINSPVSRVTAIAAMRKYSLHTNSNYKIFSLDNRD